MTAAQFDPASFDGPDVIGAPACKATKKTSLFAIKVNIFKETMPTCSWFGKATVKPGHIETVEGHARGETGGAAVRVFLQCRGITEHAGFSFEPIKE